MKRVLILIISIFTSWNIAEAQEAYQQAESFNRLAKEAFTRVEKHSNRDSVAIFKAVVDGVEYSLKSDEFDRMPNRKGKVNPKFEEENKNRLAVLHPMLIDAGKYFLKGSYTRNEGLDALQLYLKARKSPLVKDNVDESGVAAYYIAYYYLKARDLEKADEYADIAIQYDETAQAAAEVKAQCMHNKMVNEEDSLRYLSVIQQLYRTDPTNETYFSWIMKFYQNPTPKFNIEDFIDRILEENTNSTVPWILKGEIAMHAERWEEAIDAYKHADEIDPSSIPVAYNIGVCLNTVGMAAREDVAERRKKKEVVSDNEYMKYFAEARTYLERVRAKDPRRNRVDWVGPLYLDYTVLNDKIKAEELEPLVTNYRK
ncbi:hypothetical protein HMPREF0666_00481 [Prevotella sp. C561]|uniref:tetratricopeptide repeat protein n=1 Tax=Prevotella sp. C561 TaxID=563031 RepID=UPI0002238A07|nr:hypothetical protein [Prevotella sp. C561]EGW48436.1 hypothetical protein HMPREF0666_00481 [Prevotella sp. C561]